MYIFRPHKNVHGVIALRTIMLPFPVNQSFFPAFLIHKIYYLCPIVALLPCSAIVARCHVFVFIYFFYHPSSPRLPFMVVSLWSTLTVGAHVFELIPLPVD